MMLDNKPVGTNDVVVDARSKQQMSYCGIAIESTAEGWFVLPDYCCKVISPAAWMLYHACMVNRV